MKLVSEFVDTYDIFDKSDFKFLIDSPIHEK